MIDSVPSVPSPLTRAARACISRMGLASVAFFAATYATQLLVMVLAEALGAASLFDGVYAAWLLSIGSMYLVGLPVFLLILRPLAATPPDLRRLRPREFFVFFLVAYAVGYVCNLVATLLDTLLGTLIGATSSATAADMILDAPLWLVIAVPVILAPIVEEYLFRRVLIDRLLPYGQGLSILVSAILFSVYHGNLVQSVYTLAIGLILGYLYIATGRLAHCIFLHMLYNLLGTVPPLLLMRYVASPEEILAWTEEMLETMTPPPGLISAFLGYGVYLLLVGALVILGTVLFFWNIRRVRLFGPSCVIPRGERRYLLSSFGVLALALAFIGLLVLSYL